MSNIQVEGGGRPAARKSEEVVSTTCAAHVARACLAESPDHLSTQLCVLGVGVNMDGVAAYMIWDTIERMGADHVFAIVLPDRVDKRLVASVAASIGYHLRLLTGGKGNHNCTDGRTIVPVHVLKDGTSTKERCQAFFEGGVVVTTSKMLCADLLHRRLAPEVMAFCIACFPSIGVTRANAFQLSVGSGIMASLTNLAFCVEILLRGGRCSTFRNSRGSGGMGYETNDETVPIGPRIVLLSDSPCWMRYLVQRHQVGRERFTSLLHVGDIQLYPRFRLNLVEHFEKLAVSEPLIVDRSLVSVPASVQILDDLLKKVLLEVLSELQSLEKRLAAAAARTVFSDGAPTSSSRSSADASGFHYGVELHGVGRDAEADADLHRLQPRARVRVETDVDGSRPHLIHQGSYSGVRQQRAIAAKRGKAEGKRMGGDLGHTGEWRHPDDASTILFKHITAEACHETETAELDTDLAVAVTANEATWPYRLLVESLLDVRRLRRVVHFGSAYDFVFVLQDVLEKRTPRLRPGSGGPPPVTTALWTLSSHFSDIVTTATHRIGRVVEHGGKTLNRKPTTDVIDVDESGEDRDRDSADLDAEEDVVVRDLPPQHPSLPSRHPPAGARTLAIIPSDEEQETHLRYTNHLTRAWTRDRRRELMKRAASNYDTSSEDNCAPALLLIVFGVREVQSMLQRLLYPREEFQRRQLASFLVRYQLYYGIRVVRGEAKRGTGKANATAAAGAASTCEASDAKDAGGDAIAEDDGEEEDLGEEDDVGDFFDAEAVLRSRDDDPDEGEADDSRHATQRSRAGFPRTQACAGGNGGDGLLLLHGLLSQQTEPIVARSSRSGNIGDASVAAAGVAATPTGEGTVRNPAEQLALEYNAGNFAVLVADSDPICGEAKVAIEGGTSAIGNDSSDSQLPLPRVIIVDGNTLRSGDLLALVRGDDPRLVKLAATRPFTAAGTPGADATPTTPPHAAAAALPVAVRRVIVTQQSLPVLRTLETLQDELSPALLRRLRAQLVATTFSECEGRWAVERERAAFPSLANAKATLTGRMLVGRSAMRRAEEMLETGLFSSSRGSGRRARARSGFIAGHAGPVVDGPSREPPLIIFDEREFRSMLPFYLYTHGIDLVPLTLNTADYVLSPEMAVERKSLPDFFQSITGHGRINEQLTSLQRRYPHAVLLIEFDHGKPFRLLSPTASGLGPRGSCAAASLYVRIARMVAAHPRVSLVWSRSPAHSASMVTTLKQGLASANADPSDATLTGGLYAGVGGVDEGPDSEAAKALKHYAMRVLAQFPGVRAGNAEKIMRLCGSLAGLAAISRESLGSAIGEEDGDVLYNFLHTPFVHARGG